tara:strand:- start:1782 stop:2429 length:648 start_codon:yes stop_codon:yes gene_type:complete
MSIILNDESSSDEEDLEPYQQTFDQNNPYVMPYIPSNENFSHEHSIMPTPIATRVKITDQLNPVVIPQPTYKLAKNIQQDANLIKCISIFDFIFNFIYLMYGYYYFIFISIVCYCGFSGAYNYNKRRIIYYLFYQYIQLSFKIGILVYLLALKFDKNIRNSYDEKYPHSTITKSLNYCISYSALLLLFQIYISRFVKKFYDSIPDKPIVVNYTIV